MTEKNAGHGANCDGCLMLGFVTRLQKAEAQIDVLTRALGLTGVGYEPALKWLDAKMAEIDATHATGVTPPRTGDDPRTHGLNHAPLPEGSWLAPGMCAGCDEERATRVLPPDEGRA